MPRQLRRADRATPSSRETRNDHVTAATCDGDAEVSAPLDGTPHVMCGIVRTSQLDAKRLPTAAELGDSGGLGGMAVYAPEQLKSVPARVCIQAFAGVDA